MDSDVKAEATKVNAMSPAELKEQNLVMQKVTKKYGNYVAVNQLSVVVNE